MESGDSMLRDIVTWSLPDSLEAFSSYQLHASLHTGRYLGTFLKHCTCGTDVAFRVETSDFRRITDVTCPAGFVCQPCTLAKLSLKLHQLKQCPHYLR